MKRRNGSSALRDVSTRRHCAPAARASGSGHHGGTSCSSATSHGQLASMVENSGNSERRISGTARP
jgi:hypothetical protein